MQRLVQSVGAGIYEEFIFRLLFVGLGLLVFSKLLGLRRDWVAVAAVVVSAVLFSLYHLPTDRAVFYVLAGIYLGSLYLFRGYGIAVGAHAAYNIYAVLIS